MAFNIFLIVSTLTLLAIGGYLQRLRYGAAGEKLFWQRNLVMMGILIFVSVAILYLSPIESERWTSKLVMAFSIALGAYMARRPPAPGPVRKDQVNGPEIDGTNAGN